MNPTLLVVFSAGVLGTFYLYFLSARDFRRAHYGRGLTLALASTATSAICLYLGVLTIQPGHDQGFISSLVARSVFHIEVWPWLVPISFLCVAILWLMALALKAFGDHETKRGFGLSAATLVCLVPLGYAMFVLSFFAIYTGPPKSEAELVEVFELSTGFKYPDTAIVKQRISHRSDRFGDWQGSLVFEAPLLTLDTYRELAPANWSDNHQWNVWERSSCCDWQATDFPEFLPPDGAKFVVNDEDYYKFLAIDRHSKTVYFLRSSW